jgi:uncharacterized repeat protein (TIGR03803 family)
MFGVGLLLLPPIAGSAAIVGAHPAVQPAQDREVVVYRFPGGAAGSNPNGPLLVDKTGALYGSTQGGGAFGGGTVFRLIPTARGYVENVLYSFGSYTGDGTTPVGGVIADSTGALYGATYGGGLSGLPPPLPPTDNSGTVFKLTPTASGYRESLLYSFNYYCGGPGDSDGCNPDAGLISDKTGALYGTTQYGSSANYGSVYKLTPAGNGYTESILALFGLYFYGNQPNTALVERGGVLYGTTPGGITSNYEPSGGTAYSIGGSLYYQFGSYPTDGLGPSTPLIFDRSGAFFGATSGGGSAGKGTIFKLTPTASGYTESILYNFAGGWDGASPGGNLIADSTGALYGVTSGGGSASGPGLGTAFKLVPTKSGYTEIILHRFNDRGDGTNPAGLIAGPTGEIYGTTSNGGSGFGAIFKLGRRYTCSR